MNGVAIGAPERDPGKKTGAADGGASGGGGSAGAATTGSTDGKSESAGAEGTGSGGAPSEAQVKRLQESADAIKAFDRLKRSILKGWEHILQMLQPPEFQQFAEEIGLNTYFDLTPSKPMESFFRTCLDFKDPNFEVKGVDLENESSINFECKKFERFLFDHVANTDFKKSLKLKTIEKELNVAVKKTVDGLERVIAQARELDRQLVLSDLGIIISIFRCLDDKGVLVVCTSADVVGGDHKTGLWLEELAAPYYAFIEAGLEVTVASTKGGKVPVDAASRQGDAYTADAKRFDADAKATEALQDSRPIASLNIRDYKMIYVPGGHGACVDLPDNKDLIRAIETAYAEQSVVATVCHGPACLVNCKKRNGEALVKGLRVTGFSNDEEDAVGLSNKVPFSLESKLRSLGAKYEAGSNWAENAVLDASGSGTLITGQNPASSKKVAELAIQSLNN